MKMKTGNFRVLSPKVIDDLVLTHHYSQRLPSAVTLVYGDIDYGPPRVVHACAMFSMATGRWPEPLWELTRLVRLPDYSLPLTKLIAKALGHVRENKLVDLIVSFADFEEDHHGGIYQASSWLYDGMRSDRLDGFNIDGVFVPARTCNAVYGTSSETDLPSLLSKDGKTCEPHYDQGKHCYWKAISKEGMRKALRLGLQSKAYPKPMLDAGGTREGNTVQLPSHMRKGKVTLPSSNGEGRATRAEVVDVGDDVMEE